MSLKRHEKRYSLRAKTFFKDCSSMQKSFRKSQIKSGTFNTEHINTYGLYYIYILLDILLYKVKLCYCNTYLYINVM